MQEEIKELYQGKLDVIDSAAIVAQQIAETFEQEKIVNGKKILYKQDLN